MADSQDASGPSNSKTGDGQLESSSSGSSKKKASKEESSEALMQNLLDLNPSLRNELGNLPPEQAKEALKNMDINQLLTGLTMNKVNRKDMASHKFWQTQPVPRFDEKHEKGEEKPDGPIKEVIPEQVPKSAQELPQGYEWVELDLNSETELEECYKLLTNHYVEDDNAMFRLNYSVAFLNWGLKSPGWKKAWHIGVRAQGKSRLLVATIFGIPIKLRVRGNIIDVVEINMLCIHKRLRSKRLAPTLIKEITRRCYLEGTYQAVYTAGTILPTPVSTCRYFHRPLDWLKLYEVGFSPLAPGMTKARMISRFQLPPKTSIPGWRQMEEKDIDAVHDLLDRYLKRFDLSQEFTREEVEHWFVNKISNPDDRVVWQYVVEDPSTGKITDFISFYRLSSQIISPKNERDNELRAAYLLYYATEEAFTNKGKSLKVRLNALMADMLAEAKAAKFDVVNALSLQDNPLFLENLRFGPGDGLLHYYLFNWRTAPISGGLDKRNMPDEKAPKGVGIILL